MDEARCANPHAAARLARAHLQTLNETTESNGTRALSLAMAAAALGCDSPSPERFVDMFGELLVEAVQALRAARTADVR